MKFKILVDKGSCIDCEKIMGFAEDYFARADEIIGRRNRGEAKYDAEVLKGLRKGCSIRDAIKRANRRVPEEALELSAENEADVEEHYRYQLRHEEIISRLSGGFGEFKP